MHRINDGLILKGIDKRSNPINEDNRKKDTKNDKSLALKVSQSEAPELNENIGYLM